MHFFIIDEVCCSKRVYAKNPLSSGVYTVLNGTTIIILISFTWIVSSLVLLKMNRSDLAPKMAGLIIYSACGYLLYLGLTTGEPFYLGMGAFGILMSGWDGWTLHIGKRK